MYARGLERGGGRCQVGWEARVLVISARSVARPNGSSYLAAAAFTLAVAKFALICLRCHHRFRFNFFIKYQSELIALGQLNEFYFEADTNQLEELSNQTDQTCWLPIGPAELFRRE